MPIELGFSLGCGIESSSGSAASHFGVRLEKLRDLFGFVPREVIDNDVDLPLRSAVRNHLIEEIDELFTGMAWCRLAVHFTGLHIQRSVKG